MPLCTQQTRNARIRRLGAITADAIDVAAAIGARRVEGGVGTLAKLPFELRLKRAQERVIDLTHDNVVKQIKKVRLDVGSAKLNRIA